MAHPSRQEQKQTTPWMRYLLQAVAMTTSFLLVDAQAADSQTKTILAMCRQYAEEDHIPGGELESYLQQCVRDMRDAQGSAPESSGFTPLPASPESGTASPASPSAPSATTAPATSVTKDPKPH